jgi:hypothetical protein
MFRDTRIDCLVLNVSDGGAGLVTERDIAVPPSFHLEIDGERVRRRCRVVWRDDRQIGVSYDFDSSVSDRGRDDRFER